LKTELGDNFLFDSGTELLPTDAFTGYGYYYSNDILYQDTDKAFTLTGGYIFSINSLACYTRNIGLMEELEDPGGQLEALATFL